MIAGGALLTLFELRYAQMQGLGLVMPSKQQLYTGLFTELSETSADCKKTISKHCVC